MMTEHSNESAPPSKICYATYLRIFLDKNPLWSLRDSEMISIGFTRYVKASDAGVLSFLAALISLPSGRTAGSQFWQYKFKRVELVWTCHDRVTPFTTARLLTWEHTNRAWHELTDQDRRDRLSTITCSHEEP